MLRVLFFVYLIIFSNQSLSDQSTPLVNVKTAWFTPTLLQDNDIACKSLLDDAKLKFYSDSAWGEVYGVQGHGFPKTGTILDWQILGGNSLTKLHAYDKDFYLHNFRHSGCGGACERNQSLISETPLQVGSWTELSKKAESSPPAMSYGYTYAQSKSKIPYMFVLGQYEEFRNKLFVYRLSSEAKWLSACEIGLSATEVPFNEEHSYFKAKQHINDLYNKTLNLSRGGGSCGSMNTIWRWRRSVSHQLNMSLIRPWALKLKLRQSKNSYGDYSRIIKQLEQWSLVGLSEEGAFNDYKIQLKLTIRELSSFYQKANQWSKQQSDNIAEFALTSAISHGFGFYLFEPEFSTGESKLRSAIVNNSPMELIKSIGFDPKNVDGVLQNHSRHEAKESILNIAISRPEVLEYLLEQGVDPNKNNSFGKTPLMYAAQYNLIDAAKLLIEHGASTVMSTLKPNDRCYYTLRTFKMTALHYAVRYASPEFIKLLLDNGAVTYMKTENHHKSPVKEETPLDWLLRYTNKNSTELNINIPQKKVPSLKKLLMLPSNEELKKKEKQLIDSALLAYKEGKFQEAYENLLKSLSINPNNEKALSDMSLIALRNQRLGHSLSASDSLIKVSKNKNAIANALFNQGLVCEQQYKKSLNENKSFMIEYDGHYYCREPFIFSYINSWLSEKNAARKSKIKEQFDSKYSHNCSIKLADNKEYLFSFLQSKILLLHSKDAPISLNNLIRKVQFSHIGASSYKLDKITSSDVINIYDFDEFIVEEIKSPLGYYRVGYNGEVKCNTINSATTANN